MLTEMTDFTSSGIKKRSRVGKFVLEESMTIERKGKWGEKPEPTGIFNGNSEAKSCWLKIKSGVRSKNVRTGSQMWKDNLGLFTQECHPVLITGFICATSCAQE